MNDQKQASEYKKNGEKVDFGSDSFKKSAMLEEKLFWLFILGIIVMFLFEGWKAGLLSIVWSFIVAYISAKASYSVNNSN